MKFKILPFLLVTICVTANLKLFAQDKINVIVKPFQFFGDDSTKVYLKTKLPQLVLSGIGVNSVLHYTPLYDLRGYEYSYSDIDYKVKKTDSLYVAKYKKLIDNAKVSFFMEGELYVVDRKFYTIINVGNFNNVVAEFKSELRPFSDLQYIIDSACNYINYRVKNSSSLQTRVSIKNFKIINDAPPAQVNDGNAIDTEFPSRYLATNLKNSTAYLLLPFTDTSKTADFVISGEIHYGSHESCNISPIIYLGKTGSVKLQIVKGYLNLNNKDQLLLNVLKNIQSSLDAIVIPKNLSEIRNFIEQKNHSQQDYIDAFNKAFKISELELAYFYADMLSENYKNEKNKGDLLKAQIYISKGNAYDAINTLGDYMAKNKDDIDANYYLGIAFLKNGNYPQAKTKLLSLADNINIFKDLYYQIGLCDFYQGANEEALEDFRKQISFYEPAHTDMYLYIAYCYRNMKNQEEALTNFNKFYQSDTSKNKSLASNYYADYAKQKFITKDFEKAYDYYGRSYKLINRKITLLGQLKAATFTDSAQYRINAIIEKGATNGVFDKTTIYSDIAAIYDSPAYLDSTYTFNKQRVHMAINYGILNARLNSKDAPYLNSYLSTQYFKLNEPDSSLFYLKKVNSPYSYLSMAELSLANADVKTALGTLKKLNDTYKLTAPRNFNKDMDEQTVLYYFYTIECKTANNEDTATELSNMNAILKRYTDENDPLLKDWNFLTYYATIRNSKQLNLPVKKALIGQLCQLVPISEDKTVPCSVK